MRRGGWARRGSTRARAIDASAGSNDENLRGGERGRGGFGGVGARHGWREYARVARSRGVSRPGARAALLVFRDRAARGRGATCGFIFKVAARGGGGAGAGCVPRCEGGRRSRLERDRRDAVRARGGGLRRWKRAGGGQRGALPRANERETAQIFPGASQMGARRRRARARARRGTHVDGRGVQEGGRAVDEAGARPP